MQIECLKQEAVRFFNSWDRFLSDADFRLEARDLYSPKGLTCLLDRRLVLRIRRS